MKKLKSGIIWNLVSYMVLALLTIILYAILLKVYGKEELGVFSIVMSFYVLSGHVGVWGLQSAAVFFVAQLEGEKEKVSKMFSAAIVIVLIVSSIVAIVLSFIANFIGKYVYSSDYISIGLRMLAPAIVLFSVNKLILGYLNGFKKMKQYALLQSLRYFIMVTYVIVIALMGGKFSITLYTFFVAETGVLLVGHVFLRKHVQLKLPNIDGIAKNLSFGSKAVFANVLEDFNTRIDVMMLGVLSSNRDVGLYSFISLIIEGIFKLLYVVRSNINPIFAELFYVNRTEELSEMYKTIKRRLFVVAVAVGGILVVCYSVFCKLFLDTEYMYTVPALGVMVFGTVILAPFFVCGNICTQSGNPLQDTIVTLVTIVFNITANIIFILKYELYGAAFATGLSYIVYAFFMSRLIKVKLKY